jgi:uncharacterized FAD-dependent dehydrogenase
MEAMRMASSGRLAQPYDVVIIGAGPAGLFSALELIENRRNLRILVLDKGHDITRRHCPALRGVCTDCRICHLISGEGGAGLYSDGKVILDLDVGGHLRDYDPSGQLRRRVLGKILSIFTRFDFVSVVLEDGAFPSLTAIQRNFVDQLGLRMKYYPVAYFGSSNIKRFVTKLVAHIAHLGVELNFGSEVQQIVPGSELKTVVYKQGIEAKEVIGRNIILAAGKEGSYWASRTLSNLGVYVKPNWTYVGVRLETTFEQARPLFVGMGLDPKISYKFPDSTKIKTHCCCRAGKTLIAKYYGFAVVGGHTPDPHANEGISTFTILLRTPPSSPLSEQQVTSLLSRVDTVAHGKLLVQRLGDFRNNVPSTNESIRENDVQSTTPDNIIAGNIRSLNLPFDFNEKFLWFVDRLGMLAPGVATPTNLLYAPAIEWWMPRVGVSSEMETSIPGLYAVGDGAGLSQGITHAAATGIIAATSILGRLDGPRV